MVAALPSLVYASATGVNVTLLVTAVAVEVGEAEAVGVFDRGAMLEQQFDMIARMALQNYVQLQSEATEE